MFAGYPIVNSPDRIPVWAWRSAFVLALSAGLMTLGLLVATLAGVADPQPFGALTAMDTFADPSHWHLSANGEPLAAPEPKNGRLELSMSAGSVVIGTYANPIDCPCTVELRAKQTAGGRDARYGLWWGDADGHPTMLAGVNSDGYMGIDSGPSGHAPAIMEWQLFPHVRSMGQVNDFRADIDTHQVTVRLNDEVAARSPIEGSRRIWVGLFAQGSPRDAAQIGFLSFSVWETKSSGS